METAKFEIIDNDLLVDAEIKDLQASGCRFTNTIFKKVTFRNVTFYSSYIENCHFMDCTFIDCVFEFTQMKNNLYTETKFINTERTFSSEINPKYFYNPVEKKAA